MWLLGGRAFLEKSVSRANDTKLGVGDKERTVGHQAREARGPVLLSCMTP